MKDQSAAKYGYLLALISPILAAYFAIRNLEWDRRGPMLVFVISIFGGTIILQTSDGSVLQQMLFDHYVGLGFDRWFFELKEMLVLSPEPGTKGDVFSHVFSYVFAALLAIPGGYFTFVSFVYGYFFVRALSKILYSLPSDKSLLLWLFLIIFISYRFIDNLQTVRTWTGLWVLFNGVYGYYETGKKRYLLLMMMAPMFHVAYLVIALPAFLAIALKRINPVVLIVIYGLSFFIQIPHNLILGQIEKSELGQRKIESYYRENPEKYWNPLEENNANWYKRYGKGWALPNAPHVVAISLILMGFFSRQRMTSLELSIFSTGLFICVVANIGSFIPAFYNRTMINGGVYILAATLMLFIRGEALATAGNSLVFRKFLLWICVLCFVPYVAYVMANMMQFTSVFMFISPIAGFFDDVNLSIRDFIGLFM